MLGVIRIAADSSDHHWERHGCGDEVLYLLAGRALFTAVGAAGTDEVLVPRRRPRSGGPIGLPSAPAVALPGAGSP